MIPAQKAPGDKKFYGVWKFEACSYLRPSYSFRLVFFFSRTLLSKLKGMTADNTPEEYGPLIESMCRWEKTKDILELIADWMEESLVVKTTPQASGKRRVGLRSFIWHVLHRVRNCKKILENNTPKFAFYSIYRLSDCAKANHYIRDSQNIGFPVGKPNRIFGFTS